MAYEGDAQCYPLHAAALDGRAADLARALAAAGQELGAALTERDVHGRTALERAIECSIAKSATTCTRLLLAASDDVAAKDSFGDTALHLAASKHSPDEPELAGLLVGAGCDPAAKDQFGYTAIDIAKREHRPRVAAFLSSNLETVVAPYRSEVAALRQLVADQGLERGLPTVVSCTVRLACRRSGARAEVRRNDQAICRRICKGSQAGGISGGDPCARRQGAPKGHANLRRRPRQRVLHEP